MRSLAFMSLLTIQGRILDFLRPIVLMTWTLEALHLPGFFTTTGPACFWRSARSFWEQRNSPSMISFDTLRLSFMEAFFLGGGKGSHLAGTTNIIKYQVELLTQMVHRRKQSFCQKTICLPRARTPFCRRQAKVFSLGRLLLLLMEIASFAHCVLR